MKRILDPGPRLSPLESLRRFTREKPGRIGAHQVLRANVTLAYVLDQSGLTPREFAEKHFHGKLSESRLMDKWLSGRATLSRISAMALDKLVPGTLALFDSPLFALLADAPISEARVAALLEPFRPPSRLELFGWLFPDFEAKLADKTFVPIMYATNTENLKIYGTVESFTVILGIMRAAEAAGDLWVHLAASQDLFRALPMVLKQPWFARHAKALGKQLLRLRLRVYYSHLLYDIDWREVRRQGKDPAYHPYRYRWPRDPQTHRFIAPPDPILPAEVIPGHEWRAMERRRAERNARRRKSKRPGP